MNDVIPERMVDARVEDSWARLNRAIKSGCSLRTCLGYWSRFVRIRDLNSCVRCDSRISVSAHHICRKILMPEARLMTGNGITLCINCHRELHVGFNGKPDVSLPMDAQDGEKIESLAEMFGILLDDAQRRNVLCDKYYYLSDSILGKFKILQGFPPQTHFPGGPLEQASLIWNQCPLSMRNAILEAMGFPAETMPILPGKEIRIIYGSRPRER